MPPRLLILAVTIFAFGALTVLALLDVGYLGIFMPHFQSWGGAQVLTDLVILAILSCLWMVADARGRNVPAWPFVLMTFALGSFGVLFYLLIRELRAKKA